MHQTHPGETGGKGGVEVRDTGQFQMLLTP